MKYTEPIILEIPDSYMEDSRGYASAADVSGKAKLSDNSSANGKASHDTGSRSTTADLNSSINAPPTQSQQEEQRNSSIKHSRSPRPFSAVTDTPPPKRQMSSGSITPWITRHDTYKEVQKQLSPYGLGPYEGKVASDKWLPFSVQSKVLTRVQIVLEEALFEFLNTNFPHVCEKMDGRRWARLSKLIELAVSIMIQLDGDKDRLSNLLDGEIYNHSSETLRCLLLKISQIRHCAVHRTKKIPVITLELMVRDAVYVTSYIQDKERTDILDSICRPLESLSFNLEARFGEILAKKAQRNLERINNKIEQLQELLKEEEIRQGVANMEMENIQGQDEGI
ncbi:hypothetical protein sscle_15g105170 [Sclerotinia sclerotiorum 1980 UF-70]|uniref:Uncharacterized protein n=1 Tax=Sclerotinia sclerotiorum (strain ATCC 18683 / 1980 / Ss-1) TaxID=665079 RepID=A0A1D9QLD2_SCLS1|nr:hypothetical protein sscle_15g105170 [Sclerotinia sclerotiorum 1980 UF-70]